MSAATIEAGSGRPPAGAADRRVWDIAATVCDPEIPVLTIADLGILRDAALVPGAEGGDDTARVTITPTYSGCPAMDAIREDIVAALTAHGYRHVQVHFSLSPAWTTDWMSEAGKARLSAYGIAPPTGSAAVSGPIRVALSVKCPRCSSLRTREITRFGSTSCKALYVCGDCQEPFDYFKVL
ncbi:1,2-phenylacetyl-CoA epoxidase subunit PaaD [Tersicoccus phoenicis]|uniref:1,2-phenylacetyl-CoA epoxidase subunit PaaD n=1 Tax=Tersicoccus phoenicis TaxID=554083 RepID=UPI0009FED561|nr:1,2-phenylacetyl-CoA epoxidase subunit PaaD [Tersicoccus phoenicis]